MAEVVRRIGLSLGSDLCWPVWYEEIVRRLDPRPRIGGRTVRFQVERCPIVPFSLRSPCPWHLIVDRLTHWYATSREWIKKAVLMDGTYVLNQPWAVQSMEKQTTYCAMLALGMPVPETWLVPPKEYAYDVDLQPTLERYARLFDLGAVGEAVGYPLYMKPYDGMGWKSVVRVEDERELREAYEESGRKVMHLQRAVEPRDDFVRVIGMGPQVRIVRYHPEAAFHDRYGTEEDFLPVGDALHLRRTMLTIDAFFGWDFNSCEAILSGGTWYPIDFANPCPDARAASLHFHLPWVVLAKIRWTLFCAATERRMRRNLDWEPFYELARAEAPFPEKLAGYAALAAERFEAAAFEDFCSEQLGDLEAVGREYLRSAHAREAVRAEVASGYPADEVEEFTELFWSRIQAWVES